MKSRRQSVLIEIIEKYDIDTQEELIEKLGERGFKVTQATVSRDIKELKILKIPVGDNQYKYIINNSTNLEDISAFSNLFKTAVLSVDFAQNMIVLKTTSGMAQGVCVAIDNVEWDGVLGTIAGDDTIFMVTSSTSRSASLSAELKKLM